MRWFISEQFQRPRLMTCLYCWMTMTSVRVTWCSFTAPASHLTCMHFLADVQWISHLSFTPLCPDRGGFFSGFKWLHRQTVQSTAPSASLWLTHFLTGLWVSVACPCLDRFSLWYKVPPPLFSDLYFYLKVHLKKTVYMVIRCCVFYMYMYFHMYFKLKIYNK